MCTLCAAAAFCTVKHFKFIAHSPVLDATQSSLPFDVLRRFLHFHSLTAPFSLAHSTIVAVPHRWYNIWLIVAQTPLYCICCNGEACDGFSWSGIWKPERPV